MTPEERIDRYLLGQANSEDIEILNELLQRDEALRRAYRFRVALEGGCREAALRDSFGTANPDPATQFPDWRFSWLHLAAAAAVMVLAAIWFIGNQLPKTIATISNISGPAFWTGDEGRVIDDLEYGMPLSGGTLEGTSPKSWLEVTFTDGSVVTLSGVSMLTFSDLGQKELHLKRGGLSADVRPQAKPMLIHTRTASLTVLGTRFEVETELTATKLDVWEGKVGIRRISDGQAVEVSANQYVVAAADVALRPALRNEPVHVWQSEMSRGPKGLHGKWLLDEGGAGARLWAIPYLTEDKKTIFTTSASVSQSSAPVVVKSDFLVRVRGRLKSDSQVFVGLTLSHRNGEFGGRFQVRMPKGEVSANSDFDLLLPLNKFSLDPSLESLSEIFPSRLDGLVVKTIWCHSLYNKAGLSISHFCIEEPTGTSILAAKKFSYELNTKQLFNLQSTIED